MEFFNVYNILIVMTFIVGYLFITIEHVTHVNKSAIALIMAVLCWVFKIADPIHSSPLNLAHLSRHMAEISQIVFFLMGALTIVEIINVHKGFNRFSKWMYFKSKRKFLWVISFSTFFLSSILDNLTTTIIMISFIQKFIKNREEKLLIGGAIVIAANAGGAWTPIGDVTTTMLWIGGQLSTLDIIQHLFFPSLICLIASLFVLSFSLKGTFQEEGAREAEDTEPSSNLILYLGLSVLLFVPIFKVLTGLPPSLGMLLGLGIIWLCTDFLHSKQEGRCHLRVPHVISKIDFSSVLFFLGILLCINALESAGLLSRLAAWMDTTIHNSSLIAIAIGLASAIVDNVPLVAATMGMYSLDQYAVNCPFWNLTAYCAGTGGSILIVGSAAGVAFMGMEKVNFIWYLRKIGPSALFGYLAGAGVYLILAV